MTDRHATTASSIDMKPNKVGELAESTGQGRDGPEVEAEALGTAERDNLTQIDHAIPRSHPADALSPSHPDRDSYPPSVSSSHPPTPLLVGQPSDLPLANGHADEGQYAVVSPVMTLDSTGFHGARSPTSQQTAGSLARAVGVGSIAGVLTTPSPSPSHGRAQSAQAPRPQPVASTSSSQRRPQSMSVPPVVQSGLTKQPSGPLEAVDEQKPAVITTTPTKDGKRPERETPRRKSSDALTAASAATAGERKSSSTASKRQLGEWTLGKTLGAGSMGKVKLAVSTVSSEKVAIKIVPRFTSTAAAQAQVATAAERRLSGSEASRSSRRPSSSRDSPPKAQANGDDTSSPSKSFMAKAHAKDLSKEVRTVREASIVLLLHHPYICGMKSMLVYPHHYYMVFEYVNGGQMLDYIISHGRLRERSARKFARQMGSALEYCHANSIVHRDLKIENILISKTGNTKIIDFGLSNLYSPRSNLSTFCGSLYFAAPELLNAKPYTGPEVDVWSFGIVLYVLVCGKVPFDDQSMPALHAKIKRGQVEYPVWLSAECKHILSRMLVTQPSNRATLREILSHPWMVKSFDGPPSTHIPHREPLRTGEIDAEVVKGMTGFEFGTTEEVEARLNEVLQSEAYQLVLKAYDARRDDRAPKSASASSLEHLSSDLRSPSRSPSKRFSGLDFYRKKLVSLAGVGGLATKNGDTGVESTLPEVDKATLTALGGKRPDELDPTRGFDPLLSIYFLVREKIEREKIYGPGVFASSTLSLNGPPPPPMPAQAYRQPAQAAYEPPTPTITEPTQAGRRSFSVGRRGGEQMRLPASAPTSPNVQMGFQPISHALNTTSPLRARVVDQPTVDGALSTDPPASPSATLARRFGSLLGRATSMSEADYKRHRQRDSLTSARAPASTLPPSVDEPSPDVPLPAVLGGTTVGRASTVSGSPARQQRHARGISLGSPPATMGRSAARHSSMTASRRPSTADPSPVTEEAEPFPREEEVASRPTTAQGGEVHDATKPVFLKGLFSVATTSTKSPQTIRDDLVRVLEQLGVQHREIKGGFECTHAPSIDLSSVGTSRPTTGDATAQTRRRSSFLGITRSPFSKDKDLDKDADDASSGRPKSPQPKHASRITTSSTSFTAMHSDNEAAISTSPRNNQPPSPTAVTGQTAERSNALLNLNPTAAGSDLVVRFDIFVVKVPWLPGLHGLQFRRRQGNAWAYSALAKRVLSDLRL